jgi:hypothetical protein
MCVAADSPAQASAIADNASYVNNDMYLAAARGSPGTHGPLAGAPHQSPQCEGQRTSSTWRDPLISLPRRPIATQGAAGVLFNADVQAEAPDQ